MPLQRVTLLTQHGKEGLIGPVFEALTEYRIALVTGFDTDLLGTFGRDIPRAGSQLDAARRKAHLGMKLGNSPMGIASEGAFVMDPFAGLIPWHVDVIVFKDEETALEVVGIEQGPALNVQLLAADVESLTDFAIEAHFPSHHLMLRPDYENDPRIWKGLADWDALRDAFHGARKLSSTGKVLVESDLRAFCNPTRQRMIRSAAENLAHKLSSKCPHCQAAGFWITDHISGLKCRRCLGATRLPVTDVWSCARCLHREERVRLNGAFAEPSTCDRCNP